MPNLSSKTKVFLDMTLQIITETLKGNPPIVGQNATTFWKYNKSKTSQNIWPK